MSDDSSIGVVGSGDVSDGVLHARRRDEGRADGVQRAVVLLWPAAVIAGLVIVAYGWFATRGKG